MTYPIIKMTGDTSVAVVFGNEISPEIHDKICVFDEALAEAAIDGIYETVPTYCTLMIHYAPQKIRYNDLCRALKDVMAAAHETGRSRTTLIEIPVCYGGEFGPDLNYVASYHKLSPKDVIRIHSDAEYLIYMLGFTPGFSYMGGMDESLATPRLSSPRVLIPAGSVGIAGAQTGIYPIDSPGGWQLIGRTPVRLYDAQRETPILLDAGMRVRFVPIDEETYRKIEKEVEAGTYQCRSYMKEDETDGH